MLDKGFQPERCGAEHRYGRRAAGDAMRRVASAIYDGHLLGGGGGGKGKGGKGGGKGGGGGSEGDSDSSEGDSDSSEAGDSTGDSSSGSEECNTHRGGRARTDGRGHKGGRSERERARSLFAQRRGRERGDRGVGGGGEATIAAANGGGDDRLAERVFGQIRKACHPEQGEEEEAHDLHRFTFDRDPSIFDDVGGVELWKKLNEQLKAGRLGG